MKKLYRRIFGRELPRMVWLFGSFLLIMVRGVIPFFVCSSNKEIPHLFSSSGISGY